MLNASESNEDEVQRLRSQLNIARNELNNLRQQMKNLTHSYRKDCDEIKQSLESWRCPNCADGENRTRPPEKLDLSLNYIGTIHTQFPEKRGTPRQPPICGDMIAKLTLNNIFTNPSHALEGLQEYSHMWILFHFHRNESTHIRAKVAPPRLNGLRTGVFATRAPHRPSPVGLSLVKIDRIMDNTIYFRGVDMVDQTPVLDIKPYIPQYDNPSLLGSVPLNLNESEISETSLTEEGAVGYDNNHNDHGGTNDRVGLNSGVERVMDGEEFRSRISEPVRIGEREAPDGEEEEGAQANQSIPVTQRSPDVSEEHVRVPAWVKKPGAFGVLFKERALAQLSLLGDEAEEKKNTITAVLCQDPRNKYLKDRLGTQCYVFKISNLNVACRYNEEARIVTVYKIINNSSDSDE